MTNLVLAQNSNLCLYSAMAVLTLAMIGYTLHLAALAPSAARPEASPALAPEPALVAAGTRDDGSSQTATPDAATPATAPPGADEPTDPAAPSRKARKAAGIARALSILGTLLVIAAVVLRGASVQRWPLGNLYEFAVAGSMFALIVYLAWDSVRPMRWLGLFVIGPVLLTLGVAITVWYTEAAQLMPSLKSVWLAIHVTVATLSVAFFTVGFALTALYLAKTRWPRAGLLAKLPQTAAIERLSYAVHVIAFPLWSFTLIAGAIWARQAWASYWNWDPKEVWTFVIWVVYAAYLHARATSGWGRKVAAWIAIAGFACIILNYTVVNVYFVGQHSYSGL